MDGFSRIVLKSVENKLVDCGSLLLAGGNARLLRTEFDFGLTGFGNRYQLSAEDSHLLGRFYSDSNAVSLDPQNGDSDIVSNLNGLLLLPAEN